MDNLGKISTGNSMASETDMIPGSAASRKEQQFQEWIY